MKLPFQPSSERVLTERVRRARLIPVDSAVAVPRPPTVDEFYLEEEFNSRGAHQLRLHIADGERLAAKPAALAAGMEPGSVETAYLIDANRPMVDAALRHYLSMQETLSPLMVRKGSTIGYNLRTAGLLVGDIAGLGGAAISYGEQPILALCQAASAGVATITAGLVGTHYKHFQLARQRKFTSDSVPDDLRPYLSVLLGPASGRSFITAVTAVGASIALCVSIGIFSLRSSIEGTASGITFGLLALGIAAASWINSYTYADSVADAVAGARRAYLGELRRHRRLAASWWLMVTERAQERVRFIRQEHKERGYAASAYVQALGLEALAQSPDVVGHGRSRAGDTPKAVVAKAINGKVL
ncbi:hypothetical protein [Nocardia caishijiensis]|uniref:Uncharacterized protein n=1 Tax=Nocardia caishijiensis TaxID=184756 RepID=A0ABQ6YE68_9NOCA|nr:hypothetical protein [Nocardia caishijiensis]KAF0835702.1 hypothetical protein FNL39_1194 [Nocardia caishijiensis]